jgi:hypothetical protein
MLNKILSLFKKPVVQVDQVNDKVSTVNTQPVSAQAKEVATAVKEKIVKPAVKAKADVQTAKKTRKKKTV